MSTLFSSPSKTAQSAASGANAISQADITQAENYVTNQEQQLRGALQNLGPNPFITAASDIAPTRINPNDATTFSAPAPPAPTQAPTEANPFAPPMQNGVPVIPAGGTPPRLPQPAMRAPGGTGSPVI